jgi:hypothetical protein
VAACGAAFSGAPLASSKQQGEGYPRGLDCKCEKICGSCFGLSSVGSLLSLFQPGITGGQQGGVAVCAGALGGQGRGGMGLRGCVCVSTTVGSLRSRIQRVGQASSQKQGEEFSMRWRTRGRGLSIMKQPVKQGGTGEQQAADVLQADLPT